MKEPGSVGVLSTVDVKSLCSIKGIFDAKEVLCEFCVRVCFETSEP